MIQSLAQQSSGTLELQPRERFDWQSETEKILSRIDPDRKNLRYDPKNESVEFSFFEATEKIAAQFDLIALEYREWRKNVREKISSFGAIGFCENFRGCVTGFRFKKNSPPVDRASFYDKPFKRIEKQVDIEFWRPRPSSEIYRKTSNLRFDISRKLERVIGLKKQNQSTNRVKIFQVGSAWIVLIEGEKTFAPKGCNRINAYRLERLSKGATC